MRFGLVILYLLVLSTARADEPVHVLVVDGNGAAGLKKGGDAYFVEAVLKSVKGYAPVVKDGTELEKSDLKKYPLIFLLNLPELSEPARTSLEAHVKAGAGAAFFLGDKVKPAHYNRLLYRKGEGLFPVSLASKPTDPLKEKQKVEPGEMLSSHPAVYLRDPRHAVCAGLGQVRVLFSVLAIDRHYPVARPKAGFPAHVQELLALPNDRDVEGFKQETQKLYRALPVEDDRFKDYRSGLVGHVRAIRTVLNFGKKAWELGDALDALLEDKGDPEDSDRPDLTVFWRKQEMKELKQDLVALRDKTRYADPMVIASSFGRGRVVVCMTSAGSDWNDWAEGLAAPTFVMLTANVAKHLTGGDEDKRPR